MEENEKKKKKKSRNKRAQEKGEMELRVEEDKIRSGIKDAIDEISVIGEESLEENQDRPREDDFIKILQTIEKMEVIIENIKRLIRMDVQNRSSSESTLNQNINFIKNEVTKTSTRVKKASVAETSRNVNQEAKKKRKKKEDIKEIENEPMNVESVILKENYSLKTEREGSEECADADFDVDKWKASSKETYELEFDGASKGNPGPAGAAALIISENKNTPLICLKMGLGMCTSNMAEYNALLVGLTLAKNRRVAHIHVRGDSKLVVSQVLGLWKVKNEKLIPMHAQIMKLKKHFKSFSISHMCRSFNSRADSLANQAINLPVNEQVLSTEYFPHSSSNASQSECESLPKHSSSPYSPFKRSKFRFLNSPFDYFDHSSSNSNGYSNQSIVREYSSYVSANSRWEGMQKSAYSAISSPNSKCEFPSPPYFGRHSSALLSSLAFPTKKFLTKILR